MRHSHKSINPMNGELIKEYELDNPGEVTSKIIRAQAKFERWHRHTFKHRAQLMRAVADVLRKHQDEYAKLMALEMGKPLEAGRAEIEKCAWCCDFYADNARGFLKREIVSTDASLSYITYRPLGVILAVMPWNFPFWQVFRFAAPALMAGNIALLKHASNVSGCALAIEEIFKRAGLPDHVFTNLMIESKQVASVIENTGIAAVTLTGSTEAGKAVASKAGEMLKKSVLELGGSDPYVIFEDADLEYAAKVCAESRLLNSGQSCIAAKRFIVVESIRKPFEDLLVAEMKKAVVGDPFDANVTMGPLARKDLQENLQKQVEESIDQGAVCLLGGRIPEGKGAFFLPTVLSHVRPGMTAFDQEIFGPVAAVVSAVDDKDAIRVANLSNYGLGSAIFTRDIKRGEKFGVKYLRAGSCFINASVKSDPRLPFGGIQQSGYGRELSHYGIKEFMNVKTIFIK